MADRVLFKEWYEMKGFSRSLAYDMSRKPDFPAERNKVKGSKMWVRVKEAEDWLVKNYAKQGD